MKQSKKTKAIGGILFNAVFGFVLATMVGVLPAVGAVAVAGGSFLLGGFFPKGVLAAGVYTEVWTGEMVKALRSDNVAPWLDGLPDYSAYSENEIIHLVDIGADPNVLINNTTYPIPVVSVEDGDIPLSLDKFQTEATRVTDDELKAISYPKMQSVVERHREAISISKYRKAIHAFGPQTNTTNTPVIATTGANDNGRRRITRADIILLKKRFDEAGVPTDGRRLVLCSDHIADLLMVDQKFADQYYNYTSGKIANLYSFQVFEYQSNPYYSNAGAKLAFKATPSAGQYQASVAFYAPRMFKATGTTKFYYSDATTNPTMQESVCNFRHYFIALPKKQEAIGAIYSAAYVPSIQAVPTTVTFPAAGGMSQVLVEATSDYQVSGGVGFTVAKSGKNLTITAADNTGGSGAKTATLTLTLVEDVTKTATVTLNQPVAG